MNKPKLSICMIAKDEEANLKRCLDSFLPIIHEPWCELIIVDTGSTDRTIHVAKEYTDQVYEKDFIPWDFSAARNYGIKKAHGEKVLIIDADEELKQESLYILEDLIMNPDHKEPTAFFNLRSFYTRDLKQFSEVLQPRLFTLDEDFCYQHAVHNKPNCKPQYLFAPNITINHYGYIFEGKKGEALYQKKNNDRSLPLLERDHKKTPDDIHTLTHLVKTYYVTRNFDKTIEYGEMWVKKMRKEKYNEGWTAFLEVFINLVGAYLAKDDIKNAEKTEREACHYSNRLTQIYLMIGNWYTGKDNEKAKELFEMAVHIETTQGSIYDQLLTSNTNNIIPEIYNWLATHEFEKGHYEKSGEYLNKGIMANNNRLPIRWDVWNQEKSRGNLIEVK